MKQSFYGGVHPHDRKELARHKAIVPLSAAPKQVVIAMSMHVGAPCKPIVAVGDQVKVGQKIGEIAGLGAPIHASVSGTVKAVEPRPYVGGGKCMSVVIENDFQDTWGSELTPHPDYSELTTDEIVEIVKEAGITGMGGAGFPTHVKISSGLGKVDTLILNGAECEPYITADHRLMLEQGEKVIGGLRILMQAFGLQEAVIGVEANKEDAIEHLNALVGGKSDVTVESLRTRYPQGAEKQLIQRITGREVPPGGLPAHVGCAVFNVGTAAAVYDAVVEGKPLTHRIVTVTGDAIKEPKNLLVPLGTSFQQHHRGGQGLQGDPRPGAHRRPHDGHRPVHPGRHLHQGHQRRALPDQEGGRPRGGRGDLPALRPLRQRLPHAPDPGVHAPVRREGHVEGGRGPQRHGLHRVRLLQLHLPRPYPPGPVLPGDQG